MQSIFRVITLLAWALWFGGIMGLFLSVQVLFHQTDRAVFLVSAPRLFIAFERYQLMLAVLAIVSCLIARTSRTTTLLVLFAIATAGALVETTVITPRLEGLRMLGATHTPQFLQLHGLSMCVYLAVAITLLIAGVIQAPRLAGEPARRVQPSETAANNS